VPHFYKRHVQRSAKAINMQPIGRLVSTPASLEVVVFSYIYIYFLKPHLQPTWLHDQFVCHIWKISSFYCNYPTWNHDFRILTKFEKSRKTKKTTLLGFPNMDEDDNEARSTKKVKTRPREGQPFQATRGVSYMDKLLEREGMQDKEINWRSFSWLCVWSTDIPWRCVSVSDTYQCPTLTWQHHL